MELAWELGRWCARCTLTRSPIGCWGERGRRAVSPRDGARENTLADRVSGVSEASVAKAHWATHSHSGSYGCSLVHLFHRSLGYTHTHTHTRLHSHSGSHAHFHLGRSQRPLERLLPRPSHAPSSGHSLSQSLPLLQSVAPSAHPASLRSVTVVRGGGGVVLLRAVWRCGSLASGAALGNSPAAPSATPIPILGRRGYLGKRLPRSLDHWDTLMGYFTPRSQPYGRGSSGCSLVHLLHRRC